MRSLHAVTLSNTEGDHSKSCPDLGDFKEPEEEMGEWDEVLVESTLFEEFKILGWISVAILASSVIAMISGELLYSMVLRLLTD